MFLNAKESKRENQREKEENINPFPSIAIKKSCACAITFSYVPVLLNSWAKQETSLQDFLHTGRDISVLFFKVTIFRNAPLELLFQFCLKRICGCFIKAIAARYTSCLSANLQNAFISFIFFCLLRKQKTPPSAKWKFAKGL